MRRSELVGRLINCLPIIHRSGIKESSTQDTVDKINHLDGPGVSKRHKWFRILEGACARESAIYKDLSPLGWENLRSISPGSADLRALKAARSDVKNAWRSEI